MSKSPLSPGSPPTAVCDLDLFSQCGFNRTEGLWEWRRTCEGGKPLSEQTNTQTSEKQKHCRYFYGCSLNEAKDSDYPLNHV